MPLQETPQCPYCSESRASEAVQCPHCSRWFADQLIGLTTHADASVREEALNNLIFVDRSTESVAALASALNDPAQSVRRAAGTVLFAFGGAVEHAMPELTSALDDSDYYVRRTAAAALSNLESLSQPTVSKLSEWKDTDDDQLRTWIAEALK